MSNKYDRHYPAIPLRNVTVFPGMVMHFDVSRKKSVKAVEASMAADELIYLVTQRDSQVSEPGIADLYTVGTIAKIKQIIKMPGKILRVQVEGLEKALVNRFEEASGMMLADVSVMQGFEKPDKMVSRAIIVGMRELLTQYAHVNPKFAKDTVKRWLSYSDAEKLMMEFAQEFMMDFDKRQQFLEAEDYEQMYTFAATLLVNEINAYTIKEELGNIVRERVDKNQKDYILREELAAINEELDGGTITEAEEYEADVEKLDSPQYVKDKLKREIKRLKSLAGNNAEANVERTYIETCLELPWNVSTEDNKDIDNAAKVLDSDHYGMKDIKERILESLAVRNITGSGKAPVICLAGPPGTGKTSIARSVAKALGKEYVRICLGGVRDEAEIRGHRKTYIGAMPGRIIEGLKNAGVNNPLMLLDEIDKISSDYKANRKETPKPLKEQFIAVENLLEKSGIHIFLGDEYEADDYAGSLAEKFYKDIPVNVMTKDMDYLQLVSNEKNIRAWMMQTTDAKWQEMLEAYDVKEAYENMPNKVFVFSEDTIAEEYGVEHGSQIVEYKALVGDKSDNIQGVNGIGEKVAIPLIREYGTIENLYADIEETGSEIEDFWASQLGMRKGAYKKLTAEGAKESAMQSKLLATIKKDIPLKISLDELRTTLNEEALISELRRYEMKSLCSEDDIAVYKEIAER